MRTGEQPRSSCNGDQPLPDVSPTLYEEVPKTFSIDFASRDCYSLLTGTFEMGDPLIRPLISSRR